MTKIRIFTGKAAWARRAWRPPAPERGCEGRARAPGQHRCGWHSVGDVLDRRIGPDVVRVTERLDAVELDADRTAWRGVRKPRALVTSMAEGMERRRDGSGGQGVDEGMTRFLAAGIRRPVLPAQTARLRRKRHLGHHRGGLRAHRRETLASSPRAVRLVRGEVAAARQGGGARAVAAVAHGAQGGHCPTSTRCPTSSGCTNGSSLCRYRSRTRSARACASWRAAREDGGGEQRNHFYLNLFGYRVDGLVNRVLPPEAQEGFFTEWADVQRRCMDELATVFAGVPTAHPGTAPTSAPSGRGAAGLRASGRGRVRRGVARRAQRATSGSTTAGRSSWPAAGVEKDALELFQAGSDLVVRVGVMTRRACRCRTCWRGSTWPKPGSTRRAARDVCERDQDER